MELIYTIPGLGTTKDLFRQISVPNFKLKVLEWPEPAPMTLREYAGKFIEQIDTSQPVNLMGVSFGGMLCCEIAEQIATRNIVLISSCKNRKELPRNIRALNMLPVQKIVNDPMYRALSRFVWSLKFEKKILHLFTEMMKAMPHNYFKHCINMIIHWDRLENSKAIYHIHGNKDRLLPHHYIQNFQVIEKGDHDMIVLRPEEINQLLNARFNGL